MVGVQVFDLEHTVCLKKEDSIYNVIWLKWVQQHRMEMFVPPMSCHLHVLRGHTIDISSK